MDSIQNNQSAYWSTPEKIAATAVVASAITVVAAGALLILATSAVSLSLPPIAPVILVVAGVVALVAGIYLLKSSFPGPIASIILDDNHGDNKKIDEISGIKVVNSNGEPLFVPALFLKDLERQDIVLNGEQAYYFDENNRGKELGKSYQKFIDLCTQGRSVEEGNLIAERLTRTIVQTASADLTIKCFKCYEKMIELIIGAKPYWNIQIAKGKATLVLQQSFQLFDVDNEEGPVFKNDKKVLYGIVHCRREIKLKLDDLAVAKPNLPSLKVEDTWTKRLIPPENNIEEWTKNTLKKLKTF